MDRALEGLMALLMDIIHSKCITKIFSWEQQIFYIGQCYYIVLLLRLLMDNSGDLIPVILDDNTAPRSFNHVHRYTKSTLWPLEIQAIWSYQLDQWKLGGGATGPIILLVKFTHCMGRADSCSWHIVHCIYLQCIHYYYVLLIYYGVLLFILIEYCYTSVVSTCGRWNTTYHADAYFSASQVGLLNTLGLPELKASLKPGIHKCVRPSQDIARHLWIRVLSCDVVLARHLTKKEQCSFFVRPLRLYHEEPYMAHIVPID